MNTTTTNPDLQSLIGQPIPADYLHQEQEAELREAAAEDFEGYPEWSAEVEAAAWSGAADFGGILVKKACEHVTCGHFRCERSTRIGGIEI